MKKISYWARDHKWSSRIIIVLSIAVLNVLAVVIGKLLNDLNVVIPVFIFSLPVALYLSAFIYYPKKSVRAAKVSAAWFYTRQKTCDVILAASALVMVIVISNNYYSGTNVFSVLHATALTNSTSPKDSSVKTYKSIAAFSASLKNENGKILKWKERKKLLNEQVKGIKSANEMSEGGKIALIFLSVIVALALLYLVASLACELSCAGSEGAALLVALGGTALVIFLLVITIRGINGKKKKKQKDEQTMPSN